MLVSKLNIIPVISLLSRVGVIWGWEWVGGIKIKANSARLGLPFFAELGNMIDMTLVKCCRETFKVMRLR